MKIYGNDDIKKSLYTETKHQTPQSPGKKFEVVLKETVDNSKNIISGPQPSRFINPLYRLQQKPSSAPKIQVTIERIENLLDILEKYRQQLADPEVTLKNIDPIMKNIMTEKENLAPILDSLPDSDGIKDIANQTMLTASLEITKFYRGDYISS